MERLCYYNILSLLIFWFALPGCCESDIGLGYRLTLAVPVVYTSGFIGKAYLAESDEMEPNFKAALSIEAVEGRYSCSLQVFLGDVKVWSSGHYSRFYVADMCVLELARDGDLRLKSLEGQVGWRSGTSGQGVQRLLMQKTGNLALVDGLKQIKWQSFNFPTDVMLWGQRLDVATRLSSFPSNSSVFFSFEVLHDKIALFLNSGKLKYSYWEFKPSQTRNINFVRVGSTGLELFNDKSHKIAQIPSQSTLPLRFLALENRSGNMGLYFYSAETRRFETSIQALNRACDLPLACKPYGICTFSNSCSCINLTGEGKKSSPDCSAGMTTEFCDNGVEVEMLELEGLATVLDNSGKMADTSKEECASLCKSDCTCVAASYSPRVCSLYGVAMGLKQVERQSRLSFMVKVSKGTRSRNGKRGVKRWVLIVVAVVDGVIILVFIAGASLYLIRKRRDGASAAFETQS